MTFGLFVLKNSSLTKQQSYYKTFLKNYVKYSEIVKTIENI